MRATVGSRSQVFTSQRAADNWVERTRTGTQRKEIEPIEIAVEDYELRHEHVPRDGDDLEDPENWTGVRLFERGFALYGSASPDETIDKVEERLRSAASLRRERSYRLLVHKLHKESLSLQSNRDMPKSARLYAASILTRYFSEVDQSIVANESRKLTEALPTVIELHDAAVQSDFDAGRIATGTATAASTYAPWRNVYGHLRIDKVKEDDFREWLNTQLANESGGKKRLQNALGELSRINKYLRRTPALRKYASAFSVEDLRLDISGIVRPADGIRQRRPLTDEEVKLLFKACNTDEESAVLALAMLGVRSLGEVAGASWESISHELGSTWLQVDKTIVDGKDGKLFLETPKDVKSRSRKGKKVMRHVPVTKTLWNLIEPMNGNGRFILGVGDELVSPRHVERTLNRLIDRAQIRTKGVSPYSLRHTIFDRTEELAGKQFRDLLHRGDDDPSIANRVYTHASATRYRKKLLVREGETCGDVLPWSTEDFFD